MSCQTDISVKDLNEVCNLHFRKKKFLLHLYQPGLTVYSYQWVKAGPPAASLKGSAMIYGC